MTQNKQFPLFTDPSRKDAQSTEELAQRRLSGGQGPVGADLHAAVAADAGGRIEHDGVSGLSYGVCRAVSPAVSALAAPVRVHDRALEHGAPQDALEGSGPEDDLSRVGKLKRVDSLQRTVNGGRTIEQAHPPGRFQGGQGIFCKAHGSAGHGIHPL